MGLFGDYFFLCIFFFIYNIKINKMNLFSPSSNYIQISTANFANFANFVDVDQIFNPVLAGFITITFVGTYFSTRLAEYGNTQLIDRWYQQLQKPSFNPPNWIFGPVWFVLYLFMAIAAYLVWYDGGGFNGCASGALFLYGIQLMLNWAWTPLFFGLHRIFDSFIILLLLDLFVIACIIFMVPINLTAVFLMLPYLMWILFATVLGGTIWKLNCPNSFLCR